MYDYETLIAEIEDAYYRLDKEYIVEVCGVTLVKDLRTLAAALGKEVSDFGSDLDLEGLYLVEGDTFSQIDDSLVALSAYLLWNVDFSYVRYGGKNEKIFLREADAVDFAKSFAPGVPVVAMYGEEVLYSRP